LPGQETWQEVDVNAVSPEYFGLVGIPIVRGRTFTATELEKGARTVIVTEATARRYWPGRDPLGQVFDMGSNQPKSLEVVGVARDAQLSSVGEIDSSYMYLPAGQAAERRFEVLVRSRTDFATTAASIGTLARELDGGAVVRVNRLEANLDYWRSGSRAIATLAGALSLLALVLASVGIYGVVSYAVNRRLREVGIRMTLGASALDVLGMILRQTLRPVAIGVLLGIGVAAISARVLQNVLFGVSPWDPIAFIASPLFLLGVAALTGLVPARTASNLDPATTLRYE
jgi:ABC-type antimicrobial peptide transport system permease subunit